MLAGTHTAFKRADIVFQALTEINMFFRPRKNWVGPAMEIVAGG
jgi:hypothetical protein